MSAQIDLSFPGDTRFVFPRGSYIRRGAEIVGRFERDELELCLLIADVWTEDRGLIQGRLGDE